VAPHSQTLLTSSVLGASTRLLVCPSLRDIETWAHFWERFESSIVTDPSLSTINKHVFLRGYLEGEPKMLVDGIAVTASTYNSTKEILRVKYGDPSRIIQAHLDFLENIRPIQSAVPEELQLLYSCTFRFPLLQTNQRQFARQSSNRSGLVGTKVYVAANDSPWTGGRRI
jgi:hypothetical protein